MHWFYILACIPATIGALLWVTSKEVNWLEWLGGTTLSFVAAVIFHLIAIHTGTGDTETWSGKMTHVIYHPFWNAEWIETYTVTVGSGKNTRTETRTRVRSEDHDPYWESVCNFGRETESFRISKGKHSEFSKLLGGKVVVKRGYRPDFDHGDKNDYHVNNTTGFVQPATTTRKFENRLKASKTLFNFIEVPETVKVFEYPNNTNPFNSSRLLGAACGKIDLLEFDRMNTRLGPTKKVNVIVVGFPKDSDPMMGKYQQAKWLGGKKNDVVFCYSPGIDKKASWSFCFGWTEKEIVKRNLESIFLSNEINNKIIPLIESEINKNYIIKDWSKFDYVTIEPPKWCFVAMIIFMLLSQGGFWFWAHINDYRKNYHVH